MVKPCDASLCKPLDLYLNHTLKKENFILNKNKQMQFLHIKKGDKQILENYRPISLLPITGKILERTLYNNMFEFFTKKDLIFYNQSGFKPGDSCIN